VWASEVKCRVGTTGTPVVIVPVQVLTVGIPNTSNQIAAIFIIRFQNSSYADCVLLLLAAKAVVGGVEEGQLLFLRVLAARRRCEVREQKTVGLTEGLLPLEQKVWPRGKKMQNDYNITDPMWVKHPFSGSRI
jgi:hypothetical protein